MVQHLKITDTVHLLISVKNNLKEKHCSAIKKKYF